MTPSKTDRVDIERELIRWISRYVRKARGRSLNPTSDLEDEQLLDSIEFLELVLFIKDQFGVEMPPEALVPERTRRVSLIAQEIVSLRSGSPHA